MIGRLSKLYAIMQLYICVLVETKMYLFGYSVGHHNVMLYVETKMYLFGYSVGHHNVMLYPCQMLFTLTLALLL